MTVELPTGTYQVNVAKPGGHMIGAYSTILWGVEQWPGYTQQFSRREDSLTLEQMRSMGWDEVEKRYFHVFTPPSEERLAAIITQWEDAERNREWPRWMM